MRTFHEHEVKLGLRIWQPGPSSLHEQMKLSAIPFRNKRAETSEISRNMITHPQNPESLRDRSLRVLEGFEGGNAAAWFSGTDL